MATTAPPEVVMPHPFRDERLALRAMGLPALADDDADLPPLAWICPACGAVQTTNPPCRACGTDPWPIDDDELAAALLADGAR
jgi:hypothetical protein